MATLYAQVVGVVVLLLGVLGLLAGDQLFGVINIELVEDIIHLISGGALAYVGFARRDLARSVVGAIGAVYLLVGVIGFVTPTLFGLLPEGYSAVDNILHLVLGALGLVAARGEAREGVTA